MATQNVGDAVQEERRRKALEILDHTQATDNGLEIPEKVPRFLGVENSGDSVLWAYFGDSLAEVASDFEQSDTDGIYSYRAHDLDGDGKSVFVPAFQVVRWVEVPNI